MIKHKISIIEKKGWWIDEKNNKFNKSWCSKEQAELYSTLIESFEHKEEKQEITEQIYYKNIKRFKLEAEFV